MPNNPLSMGNPFKPSVDEQDVLVTEEHGVWIVDKSSFVKFGTSQFTHRDNHTVLSADSAYEPECRKPHGPVVDDLSNSSILPCR